MSQHKNLVAASAGATDDGVVDNPGNQHGVVDNPGNQYGEARLEIVMKSNSVIVTK